MKEDHQDSLDGLILEIYNVEIKQLSQEIVKNVEYLTSIGFITEIEDVHRNKIYKLMKEKEQVFRFIDLGKA